MPVNTLITNNVVRIAEDVEDKVYNFRPSDTPLVSSIGRVPVENRFHEWTADTYRAPNAANAAIEGADATYNTITQPGQYNNRTQIVQDTMSISGTTEAVRKYGRSSEVSYQGTKKMVELKRDVEAAAIANGTAVTGTSGVAGQMRGLYGFVATNNSQGASGVDPNPLTNTAPTDGTTRALTETLLKDVMKLMFDNGSPDMDNLYALIPSAQRATFDTFLAGQTRFDKAEDKTLTATLEVYIGPFGRVKAVNARHMRTRDLFILNKDYVDLGVLRPMRDTELAKRGDAREFMVNTEYMLLMKNEKAHGAIRDLS